MPLYEYLCRGCGQRFELLTRSGQTPACPSCAGVELEKQLSVFAVGANGSSHVRTEAAPGPCGHCGHPGGPGSCSMN